MRSQFSALDRRCTITCITCKINKLKATLKKYYITFFKSGECLDAICIIHILFIESMVLTLYSKPSSFCGNKPSLYFCDMVGIFAELIFFRARVFLNNHNDVIFIYGVIFTWIICVKYVTINPLMTTHSPKKEPHLPHKNFTVWSYMVIILCKINLVQHNGNIEKVNVTYM